MTNKEIAQSIRQAIDEINEYIRDYHDGSYADTENPEDHLFSEVDEKLSQIRSLTHYIKPYTLTKIEKNPFLKKLDRGQLELLSGSLGCRRDQLPYMTDSALAEFILDSLPK